MPWWWNGRHDGFKIRCLHGRGGSSPPRGTKSFSFLDFPTLTSFLPSLEQKYTFSNQIFEILEKALL